MRRTAPLLLIALLLAGAAPAAAAEGDAARRERKQQISNQIQSLKDQVEDASEAEAALLGKLDDIQSRRAELDAKVGAFDKEIAKVQRSVDAAEDKMGTLQGEVVGAELRLESANAQVDAAKAQLRQRVVRAYVNNPKLSAAAMMLRADDQRDIAATTGYYKALVAGQRDALDRYSVLKAQIADLRAELERKRDEAKAQRDVIVAQRVQLETARQEQEVVRQQVLAQEDAQESVLGEIRSRKAEFTAQIVALQAESSNITAILQGVHTGQAPPPVGRGVLSHPVAGGVSSHFGPRVHPIFGDARMHNGIDYAAPTGAPIRAAADGVVVRLGTMGGYGTTTIIDHGNSLATLYAHQSATYVGLGQRVTRGQAIGAVGCTGYCTGPHLHFEVRVNGTPVDPLAYL